MDERIEYAQAPDDIDIPAGEPLGVPDALVLTPPAGGAEQVIAVAPGMAIDLRAIDLSVVTLVQQGQDLVLDFGPDGTIVLAGFFAAAESADPPTLQVGAVQLPIGQLLAAIDQDGLAEPAAGPAAGPGADAAEGSGANFNPVDPGLIGPGIGITGLLDPTALAFGVEFPDPLVAEDPGGAGGTPGTPSLPAAEPDTATARVIDPSASYNLIVTADISGTMYWTVDPQTGERSADPDAILRMETQVQALKALVEAYRAAGVETAVRFVRFNHDPDGDHLGENDLPGTTVSAEFDLQDADDYAAALAHLEEFLVWRGELGTNYEQALERATEQLGDILGEHPDRTTIHYFFSDGMPTRGDGNPDGIFGNPEWREFLFDNGIESRGVGILLGETGTINPIDSDGDIDVVGSGNFDALTDVVLETVTQAVSGNVLSNDDGGPDGFAAVPIVQVTHDGVTRTLAAPGPGGTLSGNTLTFATAAGGSFTLNFLTGVFSYVASAAATGAEIESFAYVIEDATGDQAGATLAIDVEVVGGSAPTAVGDAILAADTGAPIMVPTWALLRNDTDPDGDRLSVFGVGDAAGGGAASLESPAVVRFDPGADPAAGGFAYTATDGHFVSGKAGVTVEQGGAGPLTGTAGNDILIGSELGDVLSGGEGDDGLVGWGGDDILDGGDGDDVLSGGAGDDVLTGGGGSDVFRFEATGDGIDEIRDYVSGIDVIDLSPILGGSGIEPSGLGDFVRVLGFELQVDADGTAGGEDWQSVARFDAGPAGGYVPASLTIVYADDRAGADLVLA